MKHSFIYLLRFIRKFGVARGGLLFSKFKRQQLKSIQLPGFKFPLSLRKNTSDIETFYQVFLYEEYETKYVSNPRFIIDGGANVGLFTVWIKNRFPEARVISIEPDPGNFGMLTKNTAGLSNVHCENAGLWSRSTPLKVYDKYDRGNWGFVVEENPDGQIAALSIADLLEKYNWERIDILKLDIETSEKKVFTGNYKQWLQKTKMLIVELHDEMEEGCSKAFFEAINNTFNRYTYLIKGENTIIINHDIE